MKCNISKRIRLRKNGLKEDDTGVATTVGTIMALLVFLSLLSLVTQQFVPVWMEDKEAYHMDEVMTQFSYLKGNVDNLVMNDFTDYQLYSTFKLGSEGIPMFASSSPGIMRSRPGSGSFDLEFDINSTEEDESYEFSAGGNISLEVLNRYFESQTIVYEYGAILLEQGNREDSLIRADPAISIDNKGNNSDPSYFLNINLVDIRGERRNIGGTGAAGVTTELLGTFKGTFSSADNETLRSIENTMISLKTHYPSAWENWFANETDLNNDYVKAENNLVTVDLNDIEIKEIRVTVATVEMSMST